MTLPIGESPYMIRIHSHCHWLKCDLQQIDWIPESRDIKESLSGMQHKNYSEQHVKPELQQNHNMIVIHWWDYFNNPCPPAVGIYLHDFENLMNFFQASVIKIYPQYSVRSNFVPYLLSTSVALATNSLLRMCLRVLLSVSYTLHKMCRNVISQCFQSFPIGIQMTTSFTVFK